MSTLTWTFPVDLLGSQRITSTVTNLPSLSNTIGTTLTGVASTTPVIELSDFNNFVGIGVLWSITRFIISYTKVPEKVLTIIDMLYCGIVLHKIILVIIEVYERLIPVFDNMGGVAR